MTEKTTDQTTATTTEDEVTQQQDNDQQTDDQQETDQTERSKGNAEAAKYRRQLRDVEAERDAALAELDGLKRQKIMQDHHIEERHLKLLNTTGTFEEFEQSVKAYREVHNPYVIAASGTGRGFDLDDSPSWSDAIKG